MTQLDTGPFHSEVSVPPAYRQTPQSPLQPAVAVASSGYELHLKILLAAVFLPEGFSLFIGDFRLPLARLLLMVFLVPATSVFLSRANSSRMVMVPSDLTAIATGIWIIIAGIVTSGVMGGLKGGGALALDFAGAYYVFRRLLGPVDSSVRLVAFSGKLIVVVIGIALLDPLTGKLFTYEAVKELTGYTIAAWEWAIETHADTLYRDGLVRAMGPMEHSILFGAACSWFGILALCTFPRRLFGTIVAGIALIGVIISQSKGALLGYAIEIALAVYYSVTKEFMARWRVVGTLAALYVIFILLYSGSPIATLMRSAGLDPEAAWYREAIWETAGPMVLHSPLFGLGLSGTWDWQSSGELVGSSVDAFWLASAMMFGIPGAALVFSTIVGAFWLGPVDRAPYLSREEQRLSVALGIVIAGIVFIGFTVHIWGSCWILLGVFAGIRANLAEAAILRAPP